MGREYDMNNYYFFKGVPEEAITDYEKIEKQIEVERINQYNKDTQIIRSLKAKLSKNLFRFIVRMLHESENWLKLEIVDKPTGKYQQETRDFGMWVDQYCSGDDCYSGYCYVKLSDGKYLKWNYWM